MEVVLKRFFGFSSLRPYQSDVVHEVLRGRDCFVIMATGGGKSLCYQLPPLLTKKTAVVISPLLSLMQDQVMSLQHRGVSSDYLGSSQTNPKVVDNAQKGVYDVLYLTPEKAISLAPRFWSNMIKRGVCLLAVDEAHCISEWGPDFRIEYKMLHRLRTQLPGIPFIALTATATERVREDIKASLNLYNPFLFVGSFDRPNLFYGVNLIKPGVQIDESIFEMVRDVPRRVAARESTIIYCATIRHTLKVHEMLISMGVAASLYHGQMESMDRAAAHKAFVTDEVFVMVATIAFGMGIDKPDVRCVVHYGCPRSLESYYQESGRCGRDGLPSSCILYYSRSDFSRGDFYCAEIKSEAQKEAIMYSFIAAQRYCVLGTCRRKNLLNYFGECSSETCGNCDNCTSTVAKERDLATEAAMLLGCVEECGGRWGLNFPINVLRGSNAKKVRSNLCHHSQFYGQGKFREATWWKALGGILLTNGFLNEVINGCFRFVRISMEGKNFLHSYQQCARPLNLRLTPEMLSDDDESNTSEENLFAVQECLCDNEILLYQRLLIARKKVAEDNNHAAPYAICSDVVLRNIAKCRPSNTENLSLVDGVNLNFVHRFGAVFTHCVRDMSLELNLRLDNMDLDVSDNSDADDCPKTNGQDSEHMTFNDICSSFVYTCADDVPKDSLEAYILNTISEHNALSFQQIGTLLAPMSREIVAQAVQKLESSLLIYQRDGFFFRL